MCYVILIGRAANSEAFGHMQQTHVQFCIISMLSGFPR